MVSCRPKTLTFEILFFRILLYRLAANSYSSFSLKTIAYKFEESGDYEKAKIIYKRLLKIRPGDEQTYRDLALIYKEN